MFKKLSLTTVLTVLGVVGASAVSNAATVTRVFDNFLIPDAQVKVTFDLDSSNLLSSTPFNGEDPTNDGLWENYQVQYLVEYSGFVNGTLYFNNDNGDEIATPIKSILGGTGSFTSVLSGYTRYLDYLGNLAFEQISGGIEYQPSFGGFLKSFFNTSYYEAYSNIDPDGGAAGQYPQSTTALAEFTVFPDGSFNNAVQDYYTLVSNGERFGQYNAYSLNTTEAQVLYNPTNIKSAFALEGFNNTSGAYRFVPNDVIVDPDPDPTPVATPEPGLLIGLSAVVGAAFLSRKRQQA